MTGVFVLCVLRLVIPQFAAECVAARLEHADPTNGLSRFVGYPHGAPDDKFVPNPSFWAKGIDFSCVSPWNSGGGNLRAGTLISKRHVVFAKHFPLWKGLRIVFVDGEGNVCPCYIDGKKGIDGTDIMVASLNAEVTPNIHPAKILPYDWEKHIGRGEGLPVVRFNQNDELLLNVLNAMPTNGASSKTATCMMPPTSVAQLFNRPVMIGDSGNPAFILIGNQPILLFCVFCTGMGSGSSLHRYHYEIQRAMDDLCPSYHLETFDFSKIEIPNSRQ